MTDRAPVETEASPAGEHIHMPASSLLPLLNAIGLAGAIVFVTLSYVVCFAFLALFLITTVIWIRSTARDVGKLPSEH